MDCTKLCLLIMDSHSSYIIVIVIAFYIQNVINLFMLPLHCLH